jgi:hypothetical protein
VLGHGANGFGTLNLFKGRVEVAKDMIVSEWGSGVARFEGKVANGEMDGIVSIGGVLYVATKETGGIQRGDVEIAGAHVSSERGEIASTSPHTGGAVRLIATPGGDSKWTAPAGVKVGTAVAPGGPAAWDVAALIVDAGVVDVGEDKVVVNPSGIVSGVARIKGRLDNQGGKVAAGANGGSGLVGTLTVQGSFVNALGLVDSDIAGTGNHDVLKVTESADLGGTLGANLLNGFVPSPWLEDGSVGHYFAVLKADGSLNGTFDATSAPDPESLDLPELPSEEHHYEWKTVYDRDDGSPYVKLVELNGTFISEQDWLGNGTNDVVLLIMQIPPPEGEADVYETTAGTSIEGEGLLENDEYLGDEGMTTVLVDEPGHGTLDLNANGSFLYVPDGGFSGIDTFTYRPVAGEYEGAAVIVTLVVAGSSLVAADDQYEMLGDGQFDAGAPGVIANDSGSLSGATLVSGPAHGEITLNSDGSFMYQPAAWFHGQDEFRYVLFDGSSASNIAVVTLVVQPYTPEAVPDDFPAYAGDPLNETVLTNDLNANAAQLVPNSGPAVGSLTFNANGTFTYTSPAGFSGQVTFEYIALHTQYGTQSQPALVTIDVLDYEPLTLAGPAIESSAAAVTAAELARIGRAAIERWRLAGVDEATLAGRLAGLEFVIADLPGNVLAGAAASGTIVVDVNAAGHGWFVDPTPLADEEFLRQMSPSEWRAGSGSPAADDADLLTAVMHEIGHLLRLAHADDPTSVLSATLPLGTRRLATAVEAAAADYLYYQWQAKRRRAG